MNKKGEVLVFVIFALILTLIILIAVGFVATNKENETIRKSISAVGYDVYDVEFFLRTTGSSLKDFENSPSLRNQYEVFKSGGKSDFIQSAISKEKESKSNSSGIATGMAVGMATGMMMNNNN